MQQLRMPNVEQKGMNGKEEISRNCVKISLSKRDNNYGKIWEKKRLSYKEIELQKRRAEVKEAREDNKGKIINNKMNGMAEAV